MKKLFKLGILFVLSMCVGSAFATTWFVRADGGTRYDATNVPSGQCDGKADVAYPGSGTNQHCAFNDFRYMWTDNSGAVTGIGSWIIVGGDTVVVRGCHALASQSNPSNPNCRIGWDNGSNGNPPNQWCPFVGNFLCSNPDIPSGTSSAHTKILSGCAYDGNCPSVQTTKDAAISFTGLTQIFGGFDLEHILNFKNTSYVDFEGFEVTTHNGSCTDSGSPSYPAGCSHSPPISDSARNGIMTNASTTHVSFKSLYIHRLNSSAFWGPIGIGISMDHVVEAFGGSGDAWNFDDGSDTANAANATLTLSYVWNIANGCYEEYPDVHTLPAQACYDTVSGIGGGDTLSGQDGTLSAITADHYYAWYNTKDSWIGPHTQIGTQTITNSYSYGNMGAQWKWGQAVGGTVLFKNNLTVGNCTRMSETLPGAAQNFNSTTGLGGSYLSNFCRAGGEELANVYRSGSTNTFAGNTFIGASNSILSFNCGYYTPVNVFNPETNCNLSTFLIKDNLFLGYDFASGTPWIFNDDSSGTSGIALATSYNRYYGITNQTILSGSACGVNNITCGSPSLTSEPAQSITTAAALDVFNPFTIGNSFYPATGSPVLAAGTPVAGMTTDYYGTARGNPPTIGGVETTGATTAQAPTLSPGTGYSGPATTVTMSSATSGATLCYTSDGSTPTADGAGTCTHGTTYATAVSVTVSETLKAVASKIGFLDSSVTTAVYTITAQAATPTFSPVAGTYTSAQTVTISSTTSGATLCYTSDGSTPTANGSGTCTHGTTYSVPVSVSTSQTLKAVASKSGNSDSAVGSAAYVINIPTVPTTTVTGTGVFSGTLTIGQ